MSPGLIGFLDLGELYLEYEYVFSSTQLTLAMLGMGATLRLNAFAEIIKVPRALIAGICIQLVAVPFLAISIATLFGLPPGLVVGMALVASVPGGTMSNVLTYFAKAHVPLSISLTAVTTAGSLVMTPLLLGVLAARYLPGGVTMPTGRIAVDIALYLLGPLLVGMSVMHFRPGISEAFSKLCIRASLGVIVVLVVGAASADRVDPASQGWLALAALALLAVSGCSLGLLLCRALGLGASEGVAVGIEATFRNTSLALLVKASAFPVSANVVDPLGDGIFYVILMYSAVSLPVSLVPLFWHRRLAAAA